MANIDVVTLGLLLLIACLVAVVSRRLGMPYAVGLVVAGIALAAAGYRSRFELTPALIFTILLPPLVFEAAINLSWRQFRDEAPLVLTLAFFGTVIAALVVAGGMHWVVGWSWLGAMLFGSLIAAIDPVAVIAMMKELSVGDRPRFLMESESLLNDGAAAVLFSLFAGAIGGESLTAGGIAATLASQVAGGVGCGLGVAGGLLLVAGRADDHLVELTLTVLAAYGSFIIAEELNVSGVLATVAAGMLIGNRAPNRVLTERGGEAMVRFWQFAAFLANSVIFLLIGGRVANQPLLAYIAPAAAGVALVLAGRAVAIYPIAALFARSRLRVSRKMQHLMFWGGLRGALALALALACPAKLPERDALIGVAFAVVAFSIFVQGLTMPLLLRRIGDQTG